MKFGRLPLTTTTVLLTGLDLFASSTSTAAFIIVPKKKSSASFHHRQPSASSSSWGHSKSATANSANRSSNTQLFNEIWRTPGKPDDHPDYRMGNNINLDPPMYYEKDAREMARSDVQPLQEASDNDLTEEEYQQKESEEMEALRNEDLQLNALMEQAELLAEELRLREQEEIFYRRFEEDDLEASSASSGESEASGGEIVNYDKQQEPEQGQEPMITDPENILGTVPDREIVNYQVEPPERSEIVDQYVDQEEPPELPEPTPEELYEAEMRQKGIEEAKRQISEASRIREERAMMEMEMKQRGVDEAKRRNAEAARIRAEREQAKVLEKIEARKNTIIAAQKLRGDEGGKTRFEIEQEMKMRGVEEARRRNAEAARIRAEREKQQVLAQAEARKRGIEAARRMREESARRAEEAKERVVMQREAMRKAAQEAMGRRVEDRERMLDQEGVPVDSREVNFIVSEEGGVQGRGDEASEGGNGPNESTNTSGDDDGPDGPDDKPSMGDVMRIIG